MISDDEFTDLHRQVTRDVEAVERRVEAQLAAMRIKMHQPTSAVTQQQFNELWNYVKDLSNIVGRQNYQIDMLHKAIEDLIHGDAPEMTPEQAGLKHYHCR